MHLLDPPDQLSEPRLKVMRRKIMPDLLHSPAPPLSPLLCTVRHAAVPSVLFGDNDEIEFPSSSIR
jgi:hypothetical protein